MQSNLRVEIETVQLLYGKNSSSVYLFDVILLQLMFWKGSLKRLQIAKLISISKLKQGVLYDNNE